MNNATNEIKNTMEGTNSRIKEAEDGINEVEDRMVEISVDFISCNFTIFID